MPHRLPTDPSPSERGAEAEPRGEAEAGGEAEPSADAQAVLAAFAQSREVRPRAITGHESPAELLASAFPAFVGRQVREAWRLMRESTVRGHTIFCTMSGAMTPAGLHRSCIVPLMEAGVIDVLTTTGANLYHDAHRVLGFRLREIAPDAGDTRLREARIIRIYDIAFPEDVLLRTDRLFGWLLSQPAFQKPMTSWPNEK